MLVKLKNIIVKGGRSDAYITELSTFLDDPYYLKNGEVDYICNLLLIDDKRSWVIAKELCLSVWDIKRDELKNLLLSDLNVFIPILKSMNNIEEK